MKVVILGIEHRVSFHHQLPYRQKLADLHPDELKAKSKSGVVKLKFINGITYCSIQASQHGISKDIYTGHTVCHESESYIKEKGRRGALREALKDGKFNRLHRTMFWKAYFNRKETPGK